MKISTAALLILCMALSSVSVGKIVITKDPVSTECQHPACQDTRPPREPL